MYRIRSTCRTSRIRSCSPVVLMLALLLMPGQPLVSAVIAAPPAPDAVNTDGPLKGQLSADPGPPPADGLAVSGDTWSAQTGTGDTSHVLEIPSDATWRSASTLVPGWEQPEFDDSGWSFASSPAETGCGSSGGPCEGMPGSFNMWDPDTWSTTAYLRKTFTVEDASMVETAAFRSSVDDDESVYVNGVLAATDSDGSAGPELSIDLKPYLRTGRNVIAIEARDSYCCCHSVCAYGSITFRADPLMLVPGQQTRSADRGQAVAYEVRLQNNTGSADSFNLSLGGHAWDTTLSTETLGPIDNGGSAAFSVQVTVPSGADWYSSDTATIVATSVADPAAYSASAAVTTQAYAPPAVSVSPAALESTQYVNEVATIPLNIGNGNGVPLAFNLVSGAVDLRRLVLWNRLGSEDEVVTGAYGPSFATRPGVLFVPGKFGGALATEGGWTGGGGYLTMSPDRFYPADRSRGTVEAWVQKRMQRFIPNETPLVGFFGGQPYDDQSSELSNLAISAYWSDGMTGNGGLQFQVRDADDVFHTANDLGWDQVPTNEWVHVAFAWDLSGIEGTQDKLRIYRDGTLVASNQDNIAAVKQDSNVVKILGHHAYDRFGQPTAYIDNMKIWDYAKTDYSDRLVESAMGDSVPWLSVDPSSGTVPGASSTPVQVTLDATAMQPGTYTAILMLRSNDPANSSISVPVQMVVNPSADMGWVGGTVNDAVSGEPLAGTIVVEGQPYTIAAGPDGVYRLWLPAGHYALHASATAYVDQTAEVDITAGSGTAQDFGMERRAPPNDDLAQAVTINALPFDGAVDAIWATTELGEPLNHCESASRTAWYKLVLDHNARVRVWGGGYPPNVLAVYQSGGPAFANLSPVTCGAWSPSLQFQAQTGIAYFLQLGAISGNSPDQDLQIHVEELPGPGNDDFSAATSVAGLPFSDSLDNSGATTEVGEPAPSCAGSTSRTVWYAFTPAAGSSLVVSADAWYGKTLAVYTGSALANLTEVGCRAFSYGGGFVFQAEAGRTYYIQVGLAYDPESGALNFGLDNAPSPVAALGFSPEEPSVVDTVQFYNSSYDPAYMDIQSSAWDFGDGATTTDSSPTHRYAQDGDYNLSLAVTTSDGRTASVQQLVRIRTHDVAISKLTAPTSARAGQARPIVVELKNTRYAEEVRVELYRRSPGGDQWLADAVQTIPARSGGRATSLSFNYTFTQEDAKMGRVTFRVVATIVGRTDAWPADNEAISVPTKVSR